MILHRGSADMDGIINENSGGVKGSNQIVHDFKAGSAIDLGNLQWGKRFYGFELHTGDHISGQIIRRAGNRGANKYFYFVERDSTGRRGWIHMENILDLTFTSDETPRIVMFSNPWIVRAKFKELKRWTDNNVFEEVMDVGQDTILTRWLITETGMEEGVEGVDTIARIVARGFEGDTDYWSKKSKVPLRCGTDIVRLMTAIASSKMWVCQSIDMKDAYLKGDDIKQEIFLKPPDEFCIGKLWRLKKKISGISVDYGWYQKVKKELLSLGMEVSPFDCSLFYLNVENELLGMICIYVDTFVFCGTGHFLDEISKWLIEMFRLGSFSQVTFTSVGINFNAYKDGVTMDQDHYVSSIDKIPISPAREGETSDLTIAEKRAFRSLVGQINWVSIHTRPDMALETSKLVGKYNTAMVDDLVKLNCLVDRLKGRSMHIYYPRLPTLTKCTLRCYSDASFGNLPSGGVQVGFFLDLESEDGLMKCPVYWLSKRIQRDLESSLAAKCFALYEGAKAAVFLKKTLEQMVMGANITVICMTDCEHLRNVIYSESKPKDRRMRLYVYCICEMLKLHDIDRVEWASSTGQVGEPSTKGGLCRNQLMDSLCRI